MSRYALIAVAALCFAGCSDPAPADDPHDSEIARLTEAVEKLRASNEELGAEVRRQGRQLAALGRAGVTQSDATGLTETPATPAHDDGSAGAADARPSVGAPVADDLTDEAAVAAFLETETGQRAIQRATAREIARREQKDRRLHVSYQIGEFARQAGLDDRQAERLQAIWKTSLDRGVELRKQFAAIGKLPESEREEARAKAMQAMRDIGRERNEQVAETLNSAQLEMYEKTEDEIVESLHGGPRR